MGASREISLPSICNEMHVRADGDEAIVNSRDVAEAFEKRHDHVLRDIDLLLGSPNLGSQTGAGWFRERDDYHDEARKEVRSFDLTRDGLILLVMGWTGPKALQIKVRYIEAFSAMEHALKERHLGLRQIATLVDSVEEIKYSARRTDANVISIQKYLVNVAPPRRDFSPETQRMYRTVIKLRYQSFCPCCIRTRVLDEKGEAIKYILHNDHWYARHRIDIDEGWAICEDCNLRLENDAQFKDDKRNNFNVFHQHRNSLKRQPDLFDL